MKQSIKYLLAIILGIAFTVPAFAATDVTASVPHEIISEKTYLRDTYQEWSILWQQWNTLSSWAKDRQWTDVSTIGPNNWTEIFTGSHYAGWPGLSNAEYEWEFKKIQHEGKLVGTPPVLDERAYITHMFVYKGEETVRYKTNEFGVQFTGSWPTYSDYWINTYRYLCDADASDETKQPVVGKKTVTTSTGGYSQTVTDHGIGGTFQYVMVDLTGYSSSQQFQIKLYGKDVVTNTRTLVETQSTIGGGEAGYIFGIFQQPASAYYDCAVEIWLQ